MILLFNIKIPKNKKIKAGLMFIFGLGSNKTTIILKKIGFAKSLCIKKLTNDQVDKLILVIKNLNYLLSFDLKKKNLNYLSQLVQIRKYKTIKKHFKTKKFKY